jgi:hypothetical protein
LNLLNILPLVGSHPGGWRGRSISGIEGVRQLSVVP